MLHGSKPYHKRFPETVAVINLDCLDHFRFRDNCQYYNLFVFRWTINNNKSQLADSGQQVFNVVSYVANSFWN